MSNIKNIREIKEYITAELTGKVKAPADDADYILSEVLGCSIPDLFLNQDRVLTEQEYKLIIRAAERRSNNEPLQYIFGQAYFMNLVLKVAPGVLIPRPETELLVEFVIKTAPAEAEICDIGIGSGAIAIAVAYERPDTTVLGVDYHHVPIKISGENMKKYNLKNLKIQKSDLLADIGPQKFDIITANLPYVSGKEYSALEKEVKDFEPKTALYADDEGCALIAKTVDQAVSHLKDKGYIIFEIGYEQGDKVAELLRENGSYSEIEIIKDLNGLDRFVKARFTGTAEKCGKSPAAS